MLLAKSRSNGGETLAEHSYNVLQMARSLFHRLTPAIRGIERLLPELETAALLHDIGKAAAGFQAMLAGNRSDWHGWRHEILSAGFASNLALSEEVVFAILTHHRQIPHRVAGQPAGRLHWSGRFPEDWDPMVQEWQTNSSEALEVWNALCENAERPDLRCALPDISNIALNSAWLNRPATRRQTRFIEPERRRKASLLRGLLMSADHLASAGRTSIPAPLNLNDFSPRFELRGFQERCAVQGHTILHAPTGSGKTEAALLWAGANQPENGRFFYTLPYTAALNAMHARLRREFPSGARSIGLLHGRAAHHLYTAAERDYPSDPQKATQEAHARAHLAREAFYPVRVCTPHQLLRFSLRGKGWEQMLSEIPGSCVVFDEVHSYEPRLAGLTFGTAKLFAAMGAKVMFISATFPKFLREQIVALIPVAEIAPDPDDPRDHPVLDRKRHTIGVVDGTLRTQLQNITDDALSDRHVLVVCNHVASAQFMAGALRGALGDSEEVVCLFHGRFNTRDRRRKEQRLVSDSPPSVLVATQVVEVSLDISFDKGYFEAAPIDALVQRMGRVNRQGSTAAPILISRTPLNSHPIYDSAYTSATLDLLSKLDGPVSEQDLMAICDTVYRNGYVGEDKLRFEETLNHPFLSNFEEMLVAGEHEEWIDQVIENVEGRADLLPFNLIGEYDMFTAERRWLDADSLLVNTYTSGLEDVIHKERSPWVIKLGYDDKQGLHSREHS
jgi:CRISPR-associated endonuclease/helicase Cas3